MAVERDQGYAFLAEWFENQSQILRKFALTYYPQDDTVELWDIKQKRMFLKRCPAEGNIRMEDLFVGSTVTVYQRQMNLVEYGNSFTRAVLGQAQERTLALIYTHATNETGKVLDVLMNEGFALGSMRVYKLSAREAQALASESKEGPSEAVISRLSSGPTFALELIARQGVAGLANLVEMRSWGDVMYYPRTQDQANRVLSLFFGSQPRISPASPLLDNTTLCLLKPHTLREGSAGRVLQAIQSAGFTVTAADVFHFDRPAADEFLEVYNGVLPSTEFQATLNELTSGRMVAMELRGPEGTTSTAQEFRELCGPYAVHIAKELFPNSLRAQFGVTVGRNAVHCTDLHEDAVLECEYFFSILRA